MSDAPTLGSMASSVTSSFDSMAKLVTAGSYVAGFGFSVASITQFKAHKDNPTQIPVGTPAALIAVSAALMYLPSIVSVAGTTSFGGAAATTGISAADVKTAASTAGVTSSDVSAAESAAKEKLSG